MKIVEYPVEAYYSSVLCEKCDVELIENPEKKNVYYTDPMQFPYICPRCKKEILLNENNKPNIKYRIIRSCNENN